MIKKDKMQNYSDLFFYFRFDNDYSCKHCFLNHALVYVYCGELEMVDPDQDIIVKSGEAAFVRKDTCMQMEVCRDNKDDAKIAILRIPESFLREFYFTIEKQENVFTVPDRSSFSIPPREDVDSLFCSMQPYYRTGTIPGEKVLKLKVIEAIYALLETDWMFYTLLFEFAYNGRVDVLDLLADTCIPPFCWHSRKDISIEPVNKRN